MVILAVNLDVFFSLYKNPMIRGPAMHDSFINFLDKFQLCRENYATGKLHFAEQKTEFDPM